MQNVHELLFFTVGRTFSANQNRARDVYPALWCRGSCFHDDSEKLSNLKESAARNDGPMIKFALLNSVQWKQRGVRQFCNKPPATIDFVFDFRKCLHPRVYKR
jgi:hypothetical protein